MDVTYKLCRSSAVAGLLFLVYAGEDGSIVVFHSLKNCWQQLKQSFDIDNGYWVTSVPKAKPGIGDKPRSEIDVHRLICTTWKGEPTLAKNRVDHKNGNPDDNSAANLDWIGARGNAVKANLRDQQFPPEFSQIIIDCRQLRSGSSALSSISIGKVDGTIVPATDILGPAKGRPKTRLSSILVALARKSSPTPEKIKRTIGDDSIVYRDTATRFPNEMTIKKEGW
jgi:hypothetical protein